MRILLLNAHYWPDLSAATAQMLTGLGEELVRSCGWREKRLLESTQIPT